MQQSASRLPLVIGYLQLLPQVLLSIQMETWWMRSGTIIESLLTLKMLTPTSVPDSWVQSLQLPWGQWASSVILLLRWASPCMPLLKYPPKKKCLFELQWKDIKTMIHPLTPIKGGKWHLFLRYNLLSCLNLNGLDGTCFVRLLWQAFIGLITTTKKGHLSKSWHRKRLYIQFAWYVYFIREESEQCWRRKKFHDEEWQKWLRHLSNVSILKARDS